MTLSSLLSDDHRMLDNSLVFFVSVEPYCHRRVVKSTSCNALGAAIASQRFRGSIQRSAAAAAVSVLVNAVVIVST